MSHFRLSVYVNLFHSLVAREIQVRYRGSWLGLFWSVINPVLLMSVYYFVFNLIFRVKLPQLYDGKDVPFAGFIFSGLIVYFLFSEIITRAPTLIQDNTNYVKKVVFPVEIIPLVTVVAAGFNFMVSFFVLGLFLVLFGGGITPMILLVPLVILPFMMFLAGLAWFISAIGVYVRDVTYIAGFISTVLIFLSPVFYAMETVPANFRSVMMLNPLSYYIEAFRSCVIGGIVPDVTSMLIVYLVGIGSFFLGYWFFQRVRGGFADVL